MRKGRSLPLHLLPLLLSSQGVLLSRGFEADWDVVHSVLVKHHQCVRLLRVLAGALPHHERSVLRNTKMK